MNDKRIKPGELVTLNGQNFAVLDVLENGDLFILSEKCVGESEYGESNYSNSSLRDAVYEWYDKFEEKIGNSDFIKTRCVDLTTLDGYTGYGSIEEKAAPLTLDEARKYEEYIPMCDKSYWFVTVWGAPGHSGAANALYVNISGNWYDGYCSSSRGVRPALIIDPLLLEERFRPDLSYISTGELLGELKRRLEN